MAEQPPIDIRADHWQIVRDILHRHVPCYEVWAFGSRAKWTAKPHSDLDLAVITDQVLPLAISAALADDFSESDLPWRVDVVDWATTSETFRKIIERDKVVVQKAYQIGLQGWGMSSEWPRVRLGEHVDACLGKMLDAKKNKGTPQPYLGNSNVRWGQFDLNDLAEMRFEPHEEERYSLLPGDLVVCEGGEPGRCAIWTGPAGMKAQKALHRIRPKRTLDNYYLFYWFQYAAKAGQLEPHFTGTTIKHLTGKAIAALEVPLPPLGIQRAMVDVLRQLDDRITLLRETNATLEAIAQALFKSWFVDFDPVRAKMEGRAPEDMDEATAALFPDSFDETELGAVPRGWSLKPFGALLVHSIGGDWGAEQPEEKNTTRVAIIRGTDIPDLQSGRDNRVPIRYTSEKKLSTRRLQDGDIVIEVSGGSKEQPTGRALYVTDDLLKRFDCPVEPASFCRLLRPADRVKGVLLAQHLRFIYDQGKTWEYQNQSTGIANFQTTHFLENELVAVPSDAVLNVFSETVRALVDRTMTSQIDNLTQIRDTLLPRLISGQLRLPEAHALIESAAV